MAAINTGKVVVGGIVSGLVLFVGDLAIGALQATEWNAIVTKLNLDMAAMETPSAFASWVVCDLLFGMVMVWVYAGIRPRFGPGPSTALKAGGVMWTTMTLMFWGLTSMGIFPVSYFMKNAVAYLIIMGTAALAGAYLYKEDAAKA